MGQFCQKRDIVFVDIEVKPERNTVEDIGAVRASVSICSANGIRFHSGSMSEFEDFIKGADFLCGHNIIDFDLNYIREQAERAGTGAVIDTLCLSALLFPQKPYHRLLKDDKLQTEELNNPLNDAVKALELLMDKVTAFTQLPIPIQKIYHTLLSETPGFAGFFSYVSFHEKTDCLSQDIHIQFKNRICENADIGELAAEYPTELAYCLAAISTSGRDTIIPY